MGRPLQRESLLYMRQWLKQVCWVLALEEGPIQQGLVRVTESVSGDQERQAKSRERRWLGRAVRRHRCSLLAGEASHLQGRRRQAPQCRSRERRIRQRETKAGSRERKISPPGYRQQIQILQAAAYCP